MDHRAAAVIAIGLGAISCVGCGQQRRDTTGGTGAYASDLSVDAKLQAAQQVDCNARLPEQVLAIPAWIPATGDCPPDVYLLEASGPDERQLIPGLAGSGILLFGEGILDTERSRTISAYSFVDNGFEIPNAVRDAVLARSGMYNPDLSLAVVSIGQQELEGLAGQSPLYQRSVRWLLERRENCLLCQDGMSIVSGNGVTAIIFKRELWISGLPTIAARIWKDGSEDEVFVYWQAESHDVAVESVTQLVCSMSICLE